MSHLMGSTMYFLKKSPDLVSGKTSEPENLNFSFSLCCHYRYPPDDGAVWAGACVRVHSLHEADGPVPLPWALLWRRLYTGCLPSPPVWEEPDPADQHGAGGWPAEEGTGHSSRLQHRQLWHLRYEHLNFWARTYTHTLAFCWLTTRERCNKATGDKEPGD